MKLLYVVPSWFTLHYQLAGQLEFLKGKGMDVHIVSTPDPRAEDLAVRVGAVFHPLEAGSPKTLWRDVAALLRLIRIIRTVKPDVIQSCTKKGGLLSGLAGRITSTPVIYVVFGLISENASAWKDLLSRPIEKLTCALARYVVMISHSNVETFRSRAICPPNKVVLFGCGSAAGVDCTRFRRTPRLEAQGQALRSSLGIPQDAPVLGFVGRIVVEKGLRELFSAWTMLRTRFPNTHLLVVSPPEVDPRLEKIVGTLQQDSRVHFTGFLPDPRPVYAAMDCLVLPTYSEGFSNVILEAGAMEVPAIATNVQGCVDAILHRRTGLLVEPQNASALTEAAATVLLNRDQAHAWGQKARERCVRDFKQEVIWQGYVELYLSLGQGHSFQPQPPQGRLDSHSSQIA